MCAAVVPIQSGSSSWADLCRTSRPHQTAGETRSIPLPVAAPSQPIPPSVRVTAILKQPAQLVSVRGDGNGLFSACSVALAGKPLAEGQIKKQATLLRALVVEYMELHLRTWRPRESAGLREQVLARIGPVNTQLTHSHMEKAIFAAIAEYNSSFTRYSDEARNRQALLAKPCFQLLAAQAPHEQRRRDEAQQMYKMRIDPHAVDSYLDLIAQDSAWAGWLELMIVSRLFDVNIVVHKGMMRQEAYALEGLPARNGTIHLARDGTDHYDAYLGDPSVQELTEACRRMHIAALRLPQPDDLPKPLAPLPPRDVASRPDAGHARVVACELPLLAPQALGVSEAEPLADPVAIIIPAAGLEDDQVRQREEALATLLECIRERQGHNPTLMVEAAGFERTVLLRDPIPLLADLRALAYKFPPKELMLVVTSLRALLPYAWMDEEELVEPARNTLFFLANATNKAPGMQSRWFAQIIHAFGELGYLDRHFFGHCLTTMAQKNFKGYLASELVQCRKTFALIQELDTKHLQLLDEAIQKASARASGGAF